MSPLALALPLPPVGALVAYFEEFSTLLLLSCVV